MILIELDKAGAEWVIVAYLANDGNMLDVVNSDVSPHVKTGSLMTRCPEELVERENKIVGQMTDPDTIQELRLAELPEIFEGDYYLPRIMSIRQAGKKSNHGLNYDMKYKRFALENEMPESDSKELVELYHRAYPGIRLNFHQYVRDRLNKDRTLTNCFGRKRKFYDAWGTELFDQAYAFIPQSTTFDTIRMGMVKTYNDRSKIFRPVQLLDEVHDSFKFQYLEKRIDDLAPVLIKIALDYMNPKLVYSSREFYIGTTAKIGYNMGNMYEVKLSEDVEAVRESIKQAIHAAKA